MAKSGGKAMARGAKGGKPGHGGKHLGKQPVKDGKAAVGDKLAKGKTRKKTKKINK